MRRRGHSAVIFIKLLLFDKQCIVLLLMIVLIIIILHTSRILNLRIIFKMHKNLTENKGSIVFLQSDIQTVLDEMRAQFREQPDYFQDKYESIHDYEDENIIGLPTERETSVLERDLPVYRAIFTRN